jgi:hypothetical protein
MGYVHRDVRQSARLLLIVLAVVGMAVDVFSNPFGPEFVLSRIHCVLDRDMPGPDALEVSAGESDSTPGIALISEVESIPQADETVAIRPSPHRLRTRHLFTAPLTTLPRPAEFLCDLGRGVFVSSRPPAQPQLCRFLC